MLGTVAYNSPEHLTGGTDARSDVYSAGILLYEVVTGDNAQVSMEKFGPLGIEQRRQYVQREISQTDQFGNRVYPPELEHIILKAISEDPAQRFQSAAEMQRVLSEKVRFVTKDDYIDGLHRTIKDRAFNPEDSSFYKELGYVDNYWREGNLRYTRYGLPQEFDTYLDEIQKLAASYPNRTSEVLERLRQDAAYGWSPQEGHHGESCG